MSLLRFGCEKESLLAATLCRDGPLPIQNREIALSRIHRRRSQRASVPTNRSAALIAGGLIKME